MKNNNAPIKSAFAPLKARFDPSLLPPAPPKEPPPATHSKPKAAAQKPKGPAQPPPQPLPAEILLLAELCERPDRENIPAWGALIKDRDRAAVVLFVNRKNWLMARALKMNDVKLVKWLAAMALAEFFYLRRRPVTLALYHTLRGILLTEDEANVHGVFFMAARLFDSPPWRSIESLPLYGPDAPLGQRHLVARVVLSKTPAESSAV